MGSVVTLPKFKAWIPGTNNPAAAYQLFTYVAGTSTPQSVFTDAACTVPASNPVILDSNGESILYAVAGTLCKFQLFDTTGTILQWTVDNITIAGGGSGGAVATSQWVAIPTAATFISGTSFSVSGDQHLTFTPSLRLQSFNTGGTVYSTVTTSSFGGGITTVTLVNDSGALDSGLTVVNMSILTSVNRSIPSGTLVDISSSSPGAMSTGTAQVQFIAGTTTNMDVLGEFSSATGRFTAKGAGTYRADFTVDMATTGVTFSASTSMQIRKNGVAVYSGNVRAIISADLFAGTPSGTVHCSAIVALAVGDYLDFIITPNFSAGAPTTALAHALVQRLA